MGFYCYILIRRYLDAASALSGEDLEIIRQMDTFKKKLHILFGDNSDMNPNIFDE